MVMVTPSRPNQEQNISATPREKLPLPSPERDNRKISPRESMVPPETASTLSLPEKPEPEQNRVSPTDVAESHPLDQAIQSLRSKLRKSKSKPATVPLVKDRLTVDVEKIMSEGLAEAYRTLTPVEQQAFKIKGEETAWEIRQLLNKTKIKIRRIFRLILVWLKMLPGLNRFFLEQEAKIKADKIMTLKRFNDQTKKIR
ncbi:MAG: hypothetical protein HY984_00850 [Candidatus Magasanikbacteria bacterium]|nr:hypothetical protein [Candidatus Magasanikbacteria bacterium]